MRTLIAKQKSTGEWLQRIDSGRKPEEKFKTEVASSFNIDPLDLDIVIDEMTEQERTQVVVDLVDGTYLGLSVVAAPAPSHEEKFKSWVESIQLSDSSMLPRWGEDMINRDGIEDLPQALIDKYNAKKTLRSEKPA